MMSPDSTSTSLTASASTLSNGSTYTFLATTDPTTSTAGASTPPPDRTSSNGETSTLSPGRASTFLEAIDLTSLKNSSKELVSSSSSENLTTKNNCSLKHMPSTCTPEKCESSPSTPRPSCSETKNIDYTSRTSFSPVKRELDFLPAPPAILGDSPTKRIALSPAEETTSKSESPLAIPSTSFKDSSHDCYSHREKKTRTESEICAFPCIPSLTDNHEAAIRNPDVTLNVVQTSAQQTIKNIIERFEYSMYANNRGNDTGVFEKDANDLLRTLPSNIAFKCIDFVLRFLEQARVLVQCQDIIRTESCPRRQTISNLTEKHETTTRNLVNEAILVVKTSAHEALTRRETISRYKGSRQIDNDFESADFGDVTRNLLMRLPKNIAYECKGFILYFLDEAVKATWTG